MSDDLDLRGIDRRHEPDPQFRAALGRRLVGILEGADPADATEPVVVSTIELESARRHGEPRRRHRWITRGAIAIATAAAVVAAVAVRISLDDTTAPADVPSPSVTVKGPPASAVATTDPPTSTAVQPTSTLDQLDRYGAKTDLVIGALAPGTYASLNVDGQGFNLRFTVPAGWTWNGRYLTKGGVGLPDGAAIFFFGRPVQVYADPCHWAADGTSSAPTGRDEADPVAALAAQPMRNATTPTDRPAPPPGGGELWPGKSVELAVPDDIDFANCDRGQFRSWGPKRNARSHQGPGQRDLVWAVDIPPMIEQADGTGLAQPPGGVINGLTIDAASFPDTPADVMSEIDAILGSIAVGYWG